MNKRVVIYVTELTKEADCLICLLYKGYLEKMNARKLKIDSKIFGGSDEIQAKYLPSNTVEYAEKLCRELDITGYANIDYRNDMVHSLFLFNSTIMFMENRFPKDHVGTLNFSFLDTRS